MKCAIPYCETAIAGSMFMCRKHWFSVPRRLQREIESGYSWGGIKAQQAGKTVQSERYVEAAKKAVATVVRREEYNAKMKLVE